MKDNKHVQAIPQDVLTRRRLKSTRLPPYLTNFLEARRNAETASVFAHVNKEDGGRFPLTGIGGVNTYALFAESILNIKHGKGRAGFIVPTGITIDDSTKQYFAVISSSARKTSGIPRTQTRGGPHGRRIRDARLSLGDFPGPQGKGNRLLRRIPHPAARAGGVGEEGVKHGNKYKLA